MNEKIDLTERINKMIDRENMMLEKIKELHFKKYQYSQNLKTVLKGAKHLAREHDNLKKFVNDQLRQMLHEVKLINDAATSKSIATSKTFLSQTKSEETSIDTKKISELEKLKTTLSLEKE